MKKDLLTVRTDGGSRGNPGPAACAFIAELDGRIIEKQSKFLGKATNNVAEYQAVLLALEWLSQHGERVPDGGVNFLLDSELVAKQLSGVYKIKNQGLQTISVKVKENIIKVGKKIFFNNVPREQNKTADCLVNVELDKH